MRQSCLAIGLAVSLTVGSADLASGALLFELNNFEDGTTQGWQVDRQSEFPTHVVETGGPAGDGDAFLQIDSGTQFGPGSRLAAFNLTENWIGSFREAGATAIEMDLMNPITSPSELDMRIVLFGDGSTDNRFTSSSAVALPNDGQWYHATFPVQEDDLARVKGSASYDRVVDDVIRVMLRHDGGSPSDGGTRIVASVGVDNVVLVGNPGVDGDFNGDGTLDVADINLLLAEVKSRNNTASFDLNRDEVVNAVDIRILVTEPGKLNTYIGDADLDREFGTGDLVEVFRAGEYEDEITMNSTWETGDWDGDGEFGSSDFVAAFSDGGYEKGPRRAAAIVPEPTAVLLFLLGTLLIPIRAHRPAQ